MKDKRGLFFMLAGMVLGMLVMRFPYPSLAILFVWCFLFGALAGRLDE
jgi:hypothetical protein